MNVARILYPVKVLGPGKRIGIWLCGCNRECFGCSNPELWEPKPEYELSVQEVVNLILLVSEVNPVDGFVISGGEPFNQVNELSELIQNLRVVSKDIIVYTGYTKEELVKSVPDSKSVIEGISVLIDGEYIQELNDNSVMRGSRNQKIHVIDDSFSKVYENYLISNHNQIQNFTTTNGIISVGIHKPGFNITPLNKGEYND